MLSMHLRQLFRKPLRTILYFMVLVILTAFFRKRRKVYLFSASQVCISRLFVVDYSESYASADAITHI